MDPVLTALPADSTHVDARPSTREVLAAVLALVGLVAASACLAVVGGAAAAPAPTAAAVLVVLYVGLRQVHFELGGANATAAQLLVVPLWFVLPPAALPLVILGAEAVACALAAGPTHRAGGAGGSDLRARLVGVPAAAWPSVGVASVLVLADPGALSIGDAPVYLAALSAQWLVAACARGLVPVVFGSGWTAALAQFPSRARELRPLFLLDAAFAPIGVVAAVAMTESPWLVLSVVPLGGLLGHFAQERDARMAQAAELSSAYRGTAQLMGDVLEADDAYTGGEHTEGVIELSLGVGRELGLPDAAMRNLEFGALLHDIGKLRVPNEIINKPGKLNAEEWEIIRQHPGFGGEMLDRVGGALSEAAPIVRAHHERWDGAGYPDQLAGAEIPIEARIITACDSFSAMTTNRSYRRAMTQREALEELERCSGTQFDPAVVTALRAVVLTQAGPAAGSRLEPVAPAASADSDATPRSCDGGPLAGDDAAQAA